MLAMPPDSLTKIMALSFPRPDQAAWLKGGEAHCDLAPVVPECKRRFERARDFHNSHVFLPGTVAK